MIKPHILLVDDEPDARELFAQHFRREIRKGDYAFDFAQSGDEALEVLQKAEKSHITLVLSDINMPGMTGIELLEEIRQLWPTTPVFMITAYGDAITEQKVRNKGASKFLTKPIDFNALRSHIASLVSGTCS